MNQHWRWWGWGYGPVGPARFLCSSEPAPSNQVFRSQVDRRRPSTWFVTYTIYITAFVCTTALISFQQRDPMPIAHASLRNHADGSAPSSDELGVSPWAPPGNWTGDCSTWRIGTRLGSFCIPASTFLLFAVTHPSTVHSSAFDIQVGSLDIAFSPSRSRSHRASADRYRPGDSDWLPTEYLKVLRSDEGTQKRRECFDDLLESQVSSDVRDRVVGVPSARMGNPHDGAQWPIVRMPRILIPILTVRRSKFGVITAAQRSPVI